MNQRGSKTAPVAEPKKVIQPTKSCYIRVAEPLPKDVTIQQIMDSLPREVYEKSNLKAMMEVTTTFVFTALGLYSIYLSPWYLLPLAWIFTGTAGCGLFVIGHDCGHRSMFTSRFLNDLVGTLTLTLLVYPYHPWRIQHNHHHANTNRLHVDNAWQPTQPDVYAKKSLIVRAALRLVKGPTWFFWQHWPFGHGAF